MSDQALPLSDVERIKEKSRYLRGTIQESLLDEMTGALRQDDQQLIKFHGTYQQFDRPLERERRKQRLEPLYSFMIRVRVPAGVVTAQQWLAIDELTGKYGIGTIKLTTRQAIELHGVLKRNLKSAIKGIHDCLLDTLAACGDVNRNVMASASPYLTRVHGEVHAVAKAIHTHLSPQTSTYHEIWIDDKLVAEGEKKDHEPIYGRTYLPRKFKIAIAIPPVNDTDIFANDIGLIAVVENNVLVGFNISMGGGMGSTFGMPETFARLGNVIGFVSKDKIVDVCEKILLVQRDNGNRSNRKLSRLKYTVERMTVAGFKVEIEKRLGYSLEAARAYRFTTNGDVFGWHKGEDGLWHVTLFIEGGRVKDTEDYSLRTGLREIAKIHHGTFILTGNQNLVIANIKESERGFIEKILNEYKITQHQKITGARANSLACVSLPLCPLAFAEAETYLPSLMDKVDIILGSLGLTDTPFNIRMTGCPNGCARPALAEIGLIGRSPEKYNIYLGGSPVGDRLNVLYRENQGEVEILSVLKDLLTRYAQERSKDERFGDFVIRQKIVSPVLKSA
ncbi:MAG: NADPH-dependent assimilatory sulfite reductase hemoprotein subunit [Candidatus Omnitrophica bacterium]|nr:NADPH-dependent assimilatory sulfite reductase hemoprotein subunit [Candidatus Omnitrophota bacterium]